MICAVFLAWYAFTGGIGGSKTLCVGAEGHFELGGGCGPACHDCKGARPCPADRALSAEEDEGPCGPCTDIPLLAEHLPSCGDDVVAKATVPNDVATAVLATSECDLVISSGGSPASSPPGGPRPALLDLASVVLLC